MMANTHELDSFVEKFRYLCSAGFDATLTLRSEKGQAHVSFNVNLGFLPPPLAFPPPASNVYSTPCQRRRSPSYYRRLKKRSDARLNLDSSFLNIASMNKCEVENSNAVENAAEDVNALSSCTDAADASSEVVKLANVPSMNALPLTAKCDDDNETDLQRHANEIDEDVGNAISEELSAVPEDTVTITEKVVSSTMDSSRQDHATLPRIEDSMYATTLNHYPLPRLEFLKF